MIVGLTGGIGSGKSTVAGMFRDLGVPVFIADQEAKSIMDHDQEVKEAICALLGKEAYHDDGPDRAYIASVVFKDREMLDKLNGIIHPAVHKRFDTWYKAQKAPYVIYEAAILFEQGGNEKCDKVILVTAPREIRISRVTKRDRASREQVLERMNNQWPDEKKIPLADIVIENIELEETLRIVKNIHQLYVKN
ncbi:dephospho-CoA kinase [Robertkochia sediminum]|uniref:dephospho-CoA kinase n=1 Tax=Robertkochia sediminum TaxID=2785326 RepID=UPI0019322E52|nr:dephospho-CoA kinase [Robertkochia sediminum]MBL7473668.1 dephospho-CoA kinase [Robertkochia sediminum]